MTYFGLPLFEGPLEYVLTIPFPPEVGGSSSLRNVVGFLLEAIDSVQNISYVCYSTVCQNLLQLNARKIYFYLVILS